MDIYGEREGGSINREKISSPPPPSSWSWPHFRAPGSGPAALHLLLCSRRKSQERKEEEHALCEVRELPRPADSLKTLPHLDLWRGEAGFEADYISRRRHIAVYKYSGMRM